MTDMPAHSGGNVGQGLTPARFQGARRGDLPWGSSLGYQLATPPDWTEQANCRGKGYEDREHDRFVPKARPRNPVKAAPPPECATCPVKARCLQEGIQAEAEGWWGGQYLLEGRPARARGVAPRVLTPDEHGRYMELYEAGLNDAEIAEQSGVTKSTKSSVYRWRVAQGLKPNTQPNDEAIRERKQREAERAEQARQRTAEREAQLARVHNERMALYRQGLSDGDIAAQLGCTRDAIQKWRLRNKLAGHLNNGKVADQRMELYLAGYSDSEIGMAVGVTRKAIGTWRRDHELPVNPIRNSSTPTLTRNLLEDAA